MPLLEMKNISKCFARVLANDRVSLQVEEGEVHALLGENGAGKSTLMNILYGLYLPDEGSIHFRGSEQRIHSPRQAIDLGIGMVHQHFMLIPALTVIENVVLGYKGNRAILDLDTAAKQFSELAERYRMPIDPFAKVEQLSVGQQQRVEILKALYRNAGLLILDEPTAVLTPQEVSGLFDMIRMLTKDGKTVIFISHKLNEIMEICNRCTVLRQGRVAAAGLKVSDIHNVHELAQLMVGKEVELRTKKDEARPGKVVLEVKNLEYSNVMGLKTLKDFSFDLHEGEILSVCGVDGNGQSELLRCLTGLLKPGGGSIRINGKEMLGKSTKEILGEKVAHIPEDRHKMGMVSQMNIRENMTLVDYDHLPWSRHGVLRWRWIDGHCEDLCQQFQIKTPGVNERSGNLSGGNQQKMVVARELDREPKLLLAVHPSRGLDIGATKYIQKRIVEERDRHAAVLLVSTELDEILELSDRILVIYEGQVMGIVHQKDATRNGLGLMMAGIVEEKQVGA